MRRIIIRNFLLFAAGLIWFRVPPWLWIKAWREVQADHLARVRKMVWEAKKAGLIYEDKEKKFWSHKTQLANKQGDSVGDVFGDKELF